MKVIIMVSIQSNFVQGKLGSFGPQLGKSYSAASTFKCRRSAGTVLILLEISTSTQANLYTYRLVKGHPTNY